MSTGVTVALILGAIVVVGLIVVNAPKSPASINAAAAVPLAATTNTAPNIINASFNGLNGLINTIGDNES